jgi:thioester reductase-like protein
VQHAYYIPAMPHHYFITGATGLVGSQLLSRLLRNHPDARATVLVRARNDAEAAERIRALALPLGIITKDIPARLTPLRGDVGLPAFGLEEHTLSALITRTSHILHGAATVRFDHPIEEARAINVAGTRTILAIARRCAERGSLQQFVYIGTSSVSGNREGLVLEGELEHGQGFFNSYEQSKSEAERFVRDAGLTVPALIFRPSIIVGDSRSGWTSLFNVIYIPMRLLQTGMLTALPGSPDTLLDIVPIDWVSETMATIMDLPSSPGCDVFHVTAGPARAARLGDVVRQAISYFDRVSPLESPRTMAYLSPAEYAVAREKKGGRERVLLAQADALLPYVTVNRLFSTTNLDRALEKSGLRFPDFAQYGEKVLAYAVRTKWGKVPQGRITN